MPGLAVNPNPSATTMQMMELLRRMGLIPAPAVPMPQLTPVVDPGRMTTIPQNNVGRLPGPHLKEIYDRVPQEGITPEFNPPAGGPPNRPPLPVLGANPYGQDPGLYTPDNRGTGANLGGGVTASPGLPNGPAMPGDLDSLIPPYSPSQGPGPAVMAPQANPLAGLMQALGAIQPPTPPELPRISSPPPPAKPQADLGNMLRLLLAGASGAPQIQGFGPLGRG